MHRRPRLLIVPMIMAGLLLGLLGSTAAPRTASAVPGAAGAGTVVAGRVGAGTAGAKPRTMKLLVIRAYTDRNTDSAASVGTIFSRANSWFGAVSGRRLRLAPTITPAYKVPGGCHGIDKRAASAASRHGYRPSRYQLIVVLAPTCAREAGSEHARLDTMTPQHLTLWGTVGRSQAVVVHQIGHVLGLEDSRTLSCRVGSRAVTIGSPSQCRDFSAREDVDVMGGGGVVGSFSAPELAQLHWFGSGQVTSRSSGNSTFTLHPLLGTGLRAIRVQASPQVAYWLEYRTRTGVDARMHSSAIGVVVRRVSVRKNRPHGDTLDPVLVDMNPSGWLDALRPGSTWTTPEGVAISVSSLDRAGAHVRVRFKAPRPSVPAAPRVTVSNGDDQVRVAWAPVADHGRPVTRVEISILDAKGRQKLDVFPDPRSASSIVLPLANGGGYTVRVRAMNDLGNSPWGTAQAAPRPAVPSVQIVSPAAGAVIDGRYATVSIVAAPHPVSRSPITVRVGTLTAPDVAAHADGGGRWMATVDLADTSDGTVTLRATAVAADGRSATTTVDVEVPTRLSAPVITSPESGAVWTAGTLSVTVVPGVDRMTGESAPAVVVYVGSTFEHATAANQWTVTFDHDDVARSGDTPNAILAESEGQQALTSPGTVLPISFR